MQITDAIADMLTRIRNANSAKHNVVEIPSSKIKKAIAKILMDEGYIRNYECAEDNKQGVLKITLKYNASSNPVIVGLRRISKLGRRIYSSCEDLPRVLRGLGIAIVSTSKGVMTDKDARKNNVGGEVLAFVW
ncbi:MAG: 30S ribosomal protein S8 [Oscillospiraceae bacterium]|jgi:small subunit ribosomal protein S8|nr:30S ribosomal protein S8 [Oscillospiraceae bacterium]